MDLVQLSISIEQRKLVFDLESETKIGVKFEFLERYFLRGPFRFNRVSEPRLNASAVFRNYQIYEISSAGLRGGEEEGRGKRWMGAASLWTVDN